MKSLLTIAFVALLTGASAQELQMDSTTKKWVYRGIVKVDSASAADLYERARLWAVTTYKMSNDQVNEFKESQQIVIAGNWLKFEQITNDDVFQHTLMIEVKDGRARYVFTDFVIEHKQGFMAGTREYMENTAIKKHRKQYAGRCATVASELEKALKFAKSSDW